MYISLMKHISRIVRNVIIRLIFPSAVMMQSNIKAISRKELTINMDVLTKCYPVGIGKHIVCIDADRKADAAIQTVCRGEPRTPIKFTVVCSTE